VISLKYDLIIKNGAIIDGTGNPSYYADIGIKDGKIRKIGSLTDNSATREFDAAGLSVSPGFIDSHTHSDGVIFLNPKLESSIRQGITTQVVGNCGCGFAPINPSRKAEAEGYIAGLLPVRVEGRWNTFREYMKTMAETGCSTNIVALVGHGTIRIAVMGSDDRAPTATELGLMKLLVAEAMEAGAVGLSTGLIYSPCIYAVTEEIIELCKVVAEHNGLFVIHLRGEGTTLIDAVEEALTIAKEAKVRTHISHHKVTGKANWGNTEITLGMIEEARDLGLEITFDQYPYIAGATTMITLLPPWVRDGGTEKLLERLRDPKTKQKIREEMNQVGQGWENMAYNNGWKNVIATVVQTEKNKNHEGKNFSEIRELRNDPDEVTSLCDLLLEEDGKARIVVFGQDENEMRQVMQHPLQMVGSDGRSVATYGVLHVGKPHPRFYGTFPRVLGKYVREEGILKLEDAIRRMTSYPAQTYKIRNKGMLKEQMDADIVIFDPTTVVDKATFQDPHQYPKGIEYVIVGGEIVIEKGTHTGALPGKPLVFQK